MQAFLVIYPASQSAQTFHHPGEWMALLHMLPHPISQKTELNQALSKSQASQSISSPHPAKTLTTNGPSSTITFQGKVPSPAGRSSLHSTPQSGPPEKKNHWNLPTISAKILGDQHTLTWSLLGCTHRGVVVFGGGSDRRVIFGRGINSRDSFSFTVCYRDRSLLS